jgi:hypothetical protein
MPRRVHGRHLQREHRVQPRRHRPPDAVVDVPLALQIVRLLVVRRPRTKPRRPLAHDGQQRVQVLRRRALPDKHLHPRPQLLQRLLRPHALVVRSHSRRDVRLQRPASHQRRVPVYPQPRPMPQRRLLNHVVRAAYHPGVVHHLRDPQHPRLPHQLRQIRRAQARPRCLHIRGGHARRQHHEHPQRQPLARRQHEPDPFQPMHVGDLVRVANHRCRAVRQHRIRVLGGQQQTALDVHVRVNKPGRDILPGQIHRLSPLVLARGGAHRRYPLPNNSHFRLINLARKHVHQLPACQQQIGRLVPSRHRK